VCLYGRNAPLWPRCPAVFAETRTEALIGCNLGAQLEGVPNEIIVGYGNQKGQMEHTTPVPFPTEARYGVEAIIFQRAQNSSNDVT
jgi:hypothetical protein